MEKVLTKKDKAEKAKEVYELALEVHADRASGKIIYWENLYQRFLWLLEK